MFQFLIGSLEALGNYYREWISEFQFLIGSLEAKNYTTMRKITFKFQFLIGSLEAKTACVPRTFTQGLFQFLIGSLEAENMAKKLKSFNLGFNSS